MNRREDIILYVGLISALITIFVFISGRSSLPDLWARNKNPTKSIVTDTSSDAMLKPHYDLRTSEFKGNVGRWGAIFNLTFNFREKKIYGTYYYPERPRVNYRITGSILGNDIQLTEFTGDKITATCKLRTSDKNCYQGTMYNTDGRNLIMNLCQTTKE